MAASTSTPSISSVPSRPTYSCIRCADRKVKCDRQRPCSACVKHNVDCVFNPLRPPSKRHRRVKEQMLTDRLRHYEAILQEQGISPSELPTFPNSEPASTSKYTTPEVSTEPQPQNPFLVEQEKQRSINKTQVVQSQGLSKFIDNALWTRVVEEFPDPEDALEDSSNDDSDLGISDDDCGFVLSSQPRSRTRFRHPPPEQIHQLWQTFVENIDPLTKVVHVPTLRPAIQRAASNVAAIPRSFEPLMFAIYGAAVMSLNDRRCKERFHEPRKLLLSRYMSATKAALSRAKFMGTINLVVLQALVLHLLSIRDIYEPRAVWSLTGVAIRIAQGMGLERDGTTLGLPPFEVEIRRRIWWFLKGHDFRTAELCGLPKFRDIDTGPESTKWPTNVNDGDLYPGMPSPPVESHALTDMVFIALRHELSSFAAGRIARFREQGKSPSHWDRHMSGSGRTEMNEAFKEVEEVIETKYIRYCDPTQPLHLMTMLMARASMNVIHFLTNHPRQWASIETTPLPERHRLWETSIKLLEQHQMLQSNPQLQQFAWHAAYFLQWHAFIHVLDTVRADPFITDAEKAWRLVGSAYENNPDMIFDTRKPIHVAVGNLCLKAYSAREAMFWNENRGSSSTPDFILQLRQQRETAKAKRLARETRNKQAWVTIKNDQDETRDADRSHDAGVAYLSNTMNYTHLQPTSISHEPNSTQTENTTEEDPFWFVNGFSDNPSDNLNDMMNIDTDFMLGTEENVTQNVTWAQWDAWLANSNVMGPPSSG